ncbi:uncharacterized protein [Coffea arabica]|uniref:RNase H type-1 domain-containing protein n=1 Tax=Coffea arabica TaxID=13443 RepID=A0ABM4WQB6_COFAR
MTQINKAISEWIECKEAQTATMEQEEIREPKEEDKRWVPPREKCIRINIDAAVQTSRGKAGWGIVTRNSEGKLISTWAIPQKCSSEPTVEEELAIQMALMKAKQKGWKEIKIRSDCKNVVGKLQENSAENVYCTTILKDIIKLKNEFDVCIFSFTRRIDNVVSHTLANFALSLITVVTWERNFPTWLNTLTKEDMIEQLLRIL